MGKMLSSSNFSNNADPFRAQSPFTFV